MASCRRPRLDYVLLQTRARPEDGKPASTAKFDFRHSPTFDGAGNLYLSDLTSVYRIDKDGLLTRVAGKRP